MKKSLFFLLLNTILVFGDRQFETIKHYYFKSYDYEQMGKYTEAIKMLTPLYKKYSNGYTLNLRFGWLFFLDGKYKDSINYYQKAALINPYAVKPKLGLIRVYLKTAQYQKAESTAQKLLKTDYYNYYGNLYIAKALIAQKKYKSALGIVRKMLSLYPTAVPFLEELAKIYKNTGNAYLQKVYEDILILDPNNVMVRSLLK